MIHRYLSSDKYMEMLDNNNSNSKASASKFKALRMNPIKHTLKKEKLRKKLTHTQEPLKLNI